MYTTFFFFFNDTATTEIYTLSLHDALPIYSSSRECRPRCAGRKLIAPRRLPRWRAGPGRRRPPDRKSTRLNSSHVKISYAVFCLKKKKKLNISHQYYYITILAIIRCKGMTL